MCSYFAHSRVSLSFYERSVPRVSDIRLLDLAAPLSQQLKWRKLEENLRVSTEHGQRVERSNAVTARRGVRAPNRFRSAILLAATTTITTVTYCNYWNLAEPAVFPRNKAVNILLDVEASHLPLGSVLGRRRSDGVEINSSVTWLEVAPTKQLVFYVGWQLEE